MTNHYHLVAETPDANLTKGMRQLNGLYMQRFNRRHRVVGHLFQGRYKAIIVQKESYLLELSRYVVPNPVRAGMVHNVLDWPWSSFPAVIEIKEAVAEQEAYYARVRASLEDLKEGRVKRGTADDLIKELKLEG